MELGCVLWETRVGSRPGISNALLREATPTHLGSGLHALGRSPAVLGLVFWLFLQTGDSASSSPWLPPRGRPGALSLPFRAQKARCPRGLRQPPQPLCPHRGAAGPGKLQGPPGVQKETI